MKYRDKSAGIRCGQEKWVGMKGWGQNKVVDRRFPSRQNMLANYTVQNIASKLFFAKIFTLSREYRI